MKLFFEKFYTAKKSNVEIVFNIPKAKSGSISIKIRQPFLWTDPYLPDLIHILSCYPQHNILFRKWFFVFLLTILKWLVSTYRWIGLVWYVVVAAGSLSFIKRKVYPEQAWQAFIELQWRRSSPRWKIECTQQRRVHTACSPLVTVETVKYWYRCNLLTIDFWKETEFQFLSFFLSKDTAIIIINRQLATVWSKMAIFREVWRNINMQPRPWASQALIPHSWAFQKGI